jgi:hypothetical protein
MHSKTDIFIELWNEIITLCFQTQSDLDYTQHIQSQLSMNQETLLKARNGLIDISEEELRDFITNCDEKISLYREILKPYANNLLVDIDNVYAPRTIGILSHWPWYDVLSDWLREIVKIVKSEYAPKTKKSILTNLPLERYIKCILSYDWFNDFCLLEDIL